MRQTPMGQLKWPIFLIVVVLVTVGSPSLHSAGLVRPSPDGGPYSKAISVTFEVPEGSTLHYTQDGSEPDASSRVYTKPIRVERDTVLRYLLLDQRGNRSVIQEAFYRFGADDATNGGLRTTADPPGGEYAKRVTVSLTSRDGATVYYTIDGSDPDTDSPVYRSPLILANDTNLKFFAVDSAGKREAIRQEHYIFRLTDRIVDTTPPAVRSIPDPATYRTGDLIRLEASEEAEIFYTLDGSEPTTKSARYQNPLRLDGSGVVRFFAVDNYGNRSKPASIRYIVDTQPPFAEANPASGLYIPPLTVKFIVSEEDAVVHYTTDGSTPEQDSPIYDRPLILTRDTILRFYAVDLFGNRQEERRDEYLFDDKPPVTAVDPPGGAYKPPIVVTLRTEEAARIHYSIDGHDPDSDSPLYSMSLTFMGPTILKCFAVDRLGNRERTQVHQYTLVNGVWRKFARGVFLIPSVTDGRTFWMGTESGLAIYRVGSGDRKFIGETEGLLGNEINDMILDEKGDLWIATQRGLNRYREGSGFSYFRVEEGVPDRQVLSLAVDLDNSIWVGTAKGAAHIVGNSVREVLTEKDGLADNTVMSIMVDPSGSKWFGTRKGLSKFTDRREWNTYIRESGLVDNEVRTVAMDSKWKVWCGTPKGVSVLDRQKWLSYTTDDGLPNNNVTLIAPDRDGEVWVATRAGVVRYAEGKWLRQESP